MEEKKRISKDYAIRNAVFELMPTEKSSGMFKEEIPGTDLSIVYAIDLKEAGTDFAEKKVMSENRYDWKTKIKKAARENTERLRPLNIFQLKDVVKPEDNEGPNVLVVTTATCFLGAAAILYPETDKKIRQHDGFEKGYYIIPSSIHELLVVPKTYVSDADALKEMLIDVNNSEVEPVDFLSNNIFEMVDGKLKVVC